MQARTIDEVISRLDDIILQAKSARSRLGYFAALYRRVTLAVRRGIAAGAFSDIGRMEHLDVVFANRYLDALNAYTRNEKTSRSWAVAFNASHDWSAIVLQHLLLGINAHINLDLGIAAAQTAPGNSIQGLKEDFNRINQILASLVDTVENELAEVWPMLKLLDWVAGKTDEAVINFSIDLARQQAWDAATRLALLDEAAVAREVDNIDRKTALVGRSIQHPGLFIGTLTSCIRLGEPHNISDIIAILQQS